MVGQKSSGEERTDEKNPVHNSGFNWFDTFSSPPQRMSGKFPEKEVEEEEPEVRSDGGIAVDSSPVYRSSDFYDIEDPADQFWWNDVEGYNSIPEVDEVFEEAGVEPVYGRQEEFIPQVWAFDGEEIEKIFRAVDEVHDGSIEQFIDEVAVSDVHPQHSKQIERFFENENYKPEFFSDYDGFPVESRVVADGGTEYSGESTGEVAGYSIEDVIGM